MKKFFGLLIVTAIFVVLTACGNTVREPNSVAIATYAQLLVQELTGANVSLVGQTGDWNMTQSDLFFGIRLDMQANDVIMNVLYQIEFTDDTFQYYEILLLQIDGVDLIDNR